MPTSREIMLLLTPTYMQTHALVLTQQFRDCLCPFLIHYYCGLCTGTWRRHGRCLKNIGQPTSFTWLLWLGGFSRTWSTTWTSGYEEDYRMLSLCCFYNNFSIFRFMFVATDVFVPSREPMSTSMITCCRQHMQLVWSRLFPAYPPASFLIRPPTLSTRQW